MVVQQLTPLHRCRMLAITQHFHLLGLQDILTKSVQADHLPHNRLLFVQRIRPLIGGGVRPAGQDVGSLTGSGDRPPGPVPPSFLVGQVPAVEAGCCQRFPASEGDKGGETEFHLLGLET